MSKILNMAAYLSYPKGTAKSKYAYRGGSPTKAFGDALKQAFPKRSGWSPAPRKGASCDVAVATVVRASGVDKKYPRGRSEQRVYKSSKFQRIVKKNARPIDYARPGDIVIYDRTQGGRKGHTFVFGGNCIYEAKNNKSPSKRSYFHRNGNLKKMRKKYPKIIILREK